MLHVTTTKTRLLRFNHNQSSLLRSICSVRSCYSSDRAQTALTRRLFTRTTNTSSSGKRFYSEQQQTTTTTSASRRRGWREHANMFGDPTLPQWSARWWLDFAVKMTVFAVTGSSTAYFVRPLVSEQIGLKGSFKDGPWSYRIVSLVVMMPVYSVLLVTFGTVLGKHAYFKHFAIRMWSRMLPASLRPRGGH